MKDDTMFGTSKSEIDELLVSTGELTVGDDFLQIENYLFEPSVAYKQTKFGAGEIENIDLKSSPPTIKIKDELIFLTARKKDELKQFAATNNIKIIERADIWDWILLPFLDTEFTPERYQRVANLLESYGLSTEKVKTIREEVKTQMLKYNFDTMLWEWISLGALDVLRAMRPKYNKEQFNNFYQRVMKNALLTKTSEQEDSPQP